MISTSGTYTDYQENEVYKVRLDYDKYSAKVAVYSGIYCISAYKLENEESYCYASKTAKNIYDIVKNSLKYCTAKNQSPIPFELGVASRHVFERAKTSYTVEKYKDDFCGCEISSDKYNIYLAYTSDEIVFGENIEWVQLSKPKKEKTVSNSASDEFAYSNETEVYVRTLDEIGLEKDITWLNGKKYYVISDDNTYENLMQAIEEYIRVKNGPIAFDTETSGLFINMFGKIGSKENKKITQINEEAEKSESPDKKTYRVDSLTGTIISIQPNVSYYFPARNRKFRNLYQKCSDGSQSPEAKEFSNNIKAKYSVGEFRDRDDDLANFIRETKAEDIPNDVLMMERQRWILTHGNIVCHNGTFDWKVCWLYNIDMNLCDDTMVMHKLLYKFTDMSRGNLGERSDLKYLTHKHFGVDQLSLSDFFTDYKEDKSGKVSGKDKKGKSKKNSKIDFSYMDYDGTRAYAPADGDFTLQLFLMFKKDLLENYSNMEYLYKVEVIMSCAIACMEFYGHRIDEKKIVDTRHELELKALLIEEEFRQVIGYATQSEINVYSDIKRMQEKLQGMKESKETSDDMLADLSLDLSDACKRLEKEMQADENKIINMASPAQIAKLFFEERKIPIADGEKQTVNKKFLKSYIQQKNEDGTLKYPEVDLYSKWKANDTLITKFFDNLPAFMYPGGFVFSNYGQISTATGRMSCNHPNAQQYNKAITKIVIPRENCIMADADFSQIEYRVLVALAKEKGLIERFKDPDMDYHTTMASLMFDTPYALVTPQQRKNSKSFNFGIPYGMGFASLAVLLTGNRQKKSIEEAKEKYELYFKEQPNVRRFFARVKEEAKYNNLTETVWHRFRKYSFTDKDGKFSKALEARALRQAGNCVIQGTAADIFKIAAARTFMFIRQNNLYGKFMVVNMIHDEQLTEIDVSKLNPKKVLAALISAMELKLNDFPPLFVGAGISDSWNNAKGKMAEIHPVLADQLVSESENEPLYLDKPLNPKEVVKYFDDRVTQFRVDKIKDYITDSKNWGQPIHPAIGNLLSLQFDFGVTNEVESKYTEANGYTKAQVEEAKSTITGLQIERFIKHYNLDVDPSNFLVSIEIDKDADEDEEYSDIELDENGEPIEVEEEHEFELLDEDESVFGIDINDIIKQFGVVVSSEKKICGIDTTILNYRMRDSLANYLSEHVTEDKGTGMEVVYLKDNNQMFNTGVYVSGVKTSEIEKVLRIRG